MAGDLDAALGSVAYAAPAPTGPVVGLMGKHPGFGDFLRAGLSEVVTDRIDQWFSATLGQMRNDLGEAWEGFWDNAQWLRFWTGREVFGQPLAGVICPSRDKVGRRYPFVLAVQGAAVPPPMVAADQQPYERLEKHLRGLEPGAGAASLLQGLEDLPDALAADDPAESPVIWAHNPTGNLPALLADAAAVDHARAAQGRSYFWSPARRRGAAAVWLGQAGLPAAPSLAWLFGGGPAANADALPEAPEAQDAHD